MNGSTEHDDFITSTRGGIIENRHLIHVAVVDSNGRLLLSTGSPHRTSLLRSAAKPAQALTILETGALERFGFGDADLALMCASHNSEERHVKRAQNMLRVIDAVEDDIRCGGHPSILPEIARSWIREGVEPTAINNNCSGKHAGMMAGAKALGAGSKGYHLLEHPMQQRVKAVVEDLAQCREGEVQWAIDGCNLPAPAMSLDQMALMFATLAKTHDSEPGSSTSKRDRNIARVFDAMTTYPEMVAGKDRFCTTLMQAYHGQLIGKVGADGVYGISIRQSDRTRKLGSGGPIGVAVKIEDGNLDILYAAVVEVLEQLEIGTAEMRGKLERFRPRERFNTADVVVGLLLWF